MRKIDLTNHVFGRLTVLGRYETKSLRSMWNCKCQCGKTLLVYQSHLRSGHTKSCGCIKKEYNPQHTITHGLSRIKNREQRLYRIWSNMKARCNTPTHFAYKNYGGRGIQICHEWMDDYMSFHKWATSNGYEDNLTIDRIDNNKGYSPYNCRWVTKGDNGRNQRTTKLTKTKVGRIREYLAVGISRMELANQFGVSRNHIKNIANGYRWIEKGE